MKDQKKTLIINTMTENRYQQLSGSMPETQLHIVDNDRRGRTVLASYDLLADKFSAAKDQIQALDKKTMNAIDGLSLSYDLSACSVKLLNKAGREIAAMDARPFVSDNWLSAAELNGNQLVLHVARYVSADLSVDNAETSFEVPVVIEHQAISVDFPIDEELRQDSSNPVQAKAIYGAIEMKFQDVSDAIDTERQARISADADIMLSVDQISTAVAVSSDNLRADIEDMSVAVALSIDQISVATGISVDTLRTDVDAMSSRIALSVDEISTAVALSVANLCATIDEMSAAVALSVDEISTNTAMSVDALRVDINDMSTAIALSVDQISTAVALSVDGVSAQTAVSVDTLRIDIDTMSSLIALSVDEMSANIALSTDRLETKTTEMSAAFALSVDGISSQTALSVAGVSAVVSDMSDVVQISVGTVLGIVGTTSADLLDAVNEETKARISACSQIGGRVDEIVDTQIPNAIEAANAATDGKLLSYVKLAYVNRTPSDTNKIITEADIEKFNQLMHLVGVVNGAPDPISSTDYSGWGDNKYKVGDVVVDETSGAEYVFLSSNENMTTKYWWELFGHQSAYATAAAFNSFKETTEEDIERLGSSLDAISSEYVPAKLSDLCSSLSVEPFTGGAAKTITSVSETNGVVEVEFSDIRIDQSAVVNLDSDLRDLSSAISGKVKVGDYGTGLGAVDTLSVVNIDADEYYRLCRLRQLDPTTVYILSSTNTNVYGERLTNVGAPVDDSDAVNLSTMTSAVNALDVKINAADARITKLATDLYAGLSGIVSADRDLTFANLSAAVLAIHDAVSSFI